MPFKGPPRELNLHRPPCKSYAANQAYYLCGQLAQLLLRGLQMQLLPETAQGPGLGALVRQLVRSAAREATEGFSAGAARVVGSAAPLGRPEAVCCWSLADLECKSHASESPSPLPAPSSGRVQPPPATERWPFSYREFFLRSQAAPKSAYSQPPIKRGFWVIWH